MGYGHLIMLAVCMYNNVCGCVSMCMICNCTYVDEYVNIKSGHIIDFSY